MSRLILDIIEVWEWAKMQFVVQRDVKSEDLLFRKMKFPTNILIRNHS